MKSTENGDGRERSIDLQGTAKRGVLSEHKMRTGTIVIIDVVSENPAQMAARWSQVLGRPAAAEAALWRIRLDQGEIRFVKALDGRGEGLGSFDVVVRDLDTVRRRAAARGLLADGGNIILAGTRVRLIPETVRNQ